MLKARLSNGDFIFGLSRANIENLLAGKPMVIDMKPLGVENSNVVILFGETEAKIYEELLPLIDLKNTEIKDEDENG